MGGLLGEIGRRQPALLQDHSYTYVYGLGLISQTDGSGVQSYFLGNGLGSTEALTDGTGTVVATYKYDVFGAIRSSGGTASTEYRFTGQQNDAASGYTYLRARYYDPATGRFISRDPFKGIAELPATEHAYAYVQNNPVNWTDPYGLKRQGVGHIDSCSELGQDVGNCISAILAGSVGMVGMVPVEVGLGLASIAVAPTVVGELALLPAEAAIVWTQMQFASLAYLGTRLRCSEIKLRSNPFENFGGSW